MPITAPGNLKFVATHNTKGGQFAGDKFTAANDNTLIGYTAGFEITTGDYNTLLGSLAGIAITNGSENTLIGYNNAPLLTGGNENVSVGDNNLSALLTGSSNISIGNNVAPTITTTSHIIAVGKGALNAPFFGTSGGVTDLDESIVIGVDAGANLDLNNNLRRPILIGARAAENASYGVTAGGSPGVVIIGSDSGGTGSLTNGVGVVILGHNSYGEENYNNVGVGNNIHSSTNGSARVNNSIAIGNNIASPTANSSMTENVFIGHQAASLRTRGHNNVQIGSMTGANPTTGDDNVFIGANAYFGSSVNSDGNIIIGGRSNVDGTGVESGNILIGSWRTFSAFGDDNTIVGGLTAFSGSGKTGSRNTMLGTRSGYDTVSGGDDCVFIGYQAGLGATCDTSVIIGSDAGGTSTGTDNVLTGYNVATVLSSGSDNTIIGSNAALTLTTGSENILLGTSSGSEITTGVKNILIGSTAGSTLGNLSNTLFIGHSTLSATPTIYGDLSTQRIGIGVTALTADVTLEMPAGDGAFLAPRLTTTERNALTAVNGMLIYNTTTAQFEGYNGAWVAL